MEVDLVKRVLRGREREKKKNPLLIFYDQFQSSMKLVFMSYSCCLVVL